MWYWPLVRSETVVWRRPGVRAFGRRLLFAVLSLPLALLWFPVLLVGLGVGVGTAVVFVGLVVLLAVLALARLLASLERTRARVLLGAALADPPPPSGGPWRALGDGRRWRELLYLLLALPLGASQGVVVLLLGAMAARGVSYPFVMWGVDLSTAWGGPTWTGAVLVHSGLGVLAILASPWLLRLVTDAHGWVARRLL